jgi:hypothetical protein
MLPRLTARSVRRRQREQENLEEDAGIELSLTRCGYRGDA